MIGSLGLIALVAKTFYHIDKSIEYDKKAMENITLAFKTDAETMQILKDKELFCEQRLNNIVKKKKAIMQFSIPKFVEVYEKIQEIIISRKNQQELLLKFDYELEQNDFDAMKILSQKHFTDKQLIVGWFFKGIGKMIELDSKKNLYSANNVLSRVEIKAEQVKSICAIYDAVIERANMIANLLVKMNALFLKSILQTKQTIEKNGDDIRKYTDFDKGTLMTCVNMAKAIVDILNIPVVDENGELCQRGLEMLSHGEMLLQDFDRALEN